MRLHQSALGCSGQAPRLCQLGLKLSVLPETPPRNRLGYYLQHCTEGHINLSIVCSFLCEGVVACPFGEGGGGCACMCVCFLGC